MSEACQLYLITPPQIADLARFADRLTAALDAGAIACIQLRMKGEDGGAPADDDVLAAADALLPVARKYDAAFLINDRPGLALKAGADGVHVGQSDAPYGDARALLGDDAVIGVTCHNSKHLGLLAGEAGADYVAFGAFFPTKTKIAAATADIDILQWWAFATTTPSVAIGGITPENCAPLVRAGADFLAVSSSVWDADGGPTTAVKAFHGAIAAA
jgi:thiamine-phosphate pyrophosphorylase